MKPQRVAVLGASGFVGGELLRILAHHPAVVVEFVGARESAGRALIDVHPHLVGVDALSRSVLEPIDPEVLSDRADVVFSALPHGSSAQLVEDVVPRGVHLIDLAGDFRLPADAYPDWYGFDHPAPEWIDKAVYGLPEVLGHQLSGAPLIANPGCYATAVVLSMAPLLSAGLVVTGAIRIDGKSGLSGAGRTASETTTFTATEESIRPYGLPRHRHTPEIERGIELATGKAVRVLFVPHLVPAVRGVLTTSYAEMEAGVTTESLAECLAAA